MKRFPSRILTAAALLLLITFNGCKKNKDEKKKPQCRIITVTISPSTYIYNINYNAEGKVGTFSSNDDLTTYTYNGNTATGTTTAGGIFSVKKIITSNVNGLTTNVRNEYNAAGTSWNNTLYEYSGTELIKVTLTTNSGSPVIGMYTWNNGNIVSFSSSGVTSEYDYYTDKPAGDGEYLYLSHLLNNIQIYRTKNALKSVRTGSAVKNFNYTYDGDGKITSVTVSGGSNVTYTYQYQCN